MSGMLLVNPGAVPGSSENSISTPGTPSIQPLESFFFATIMPEDWEWDSKKEQWFCTKVLEDENGEYIKENCLSLELELDEEATNDLINHMPEILVDTSQMSDEELEKLGYTRHEAAPMSDFLEWAMGSRELQEKYFDYISRNCLIAMSSFDRLAKFYIMSGFDKLDKPIALRISQICMINTRE